LLGRRLPHLFKSLQQFFAQAPVELAQRALNVFEIEPRILQQDSAHIFEVARAAGEHFVDDQVLQI